MRIALAGLVATALLAPSAATQSVDGMVKLSTFGNGASSYNDVWGYVDPGSGRELAILGTYRNTVFVETTNPTTPVVLATIPRAGNSTWGDFETWGTYAYGGSEGGGGLQIFDLSNIDNITLVKNDTRFFSASHNLRVDRSLGWLMAPGANTGMPILDLGNPTDPMQLRNYTAEYVHDCFSLNGFAHLGQIYRGRYEIVDITKNGFPAQDSIGTPGAFTHNAWTDALETFAVTTDESAGGHLAIYDIQDPTNIQYLSSYSRGSANIIHNAYIKGRVAHASYYTQGYVAVDVADPMHPTFRAQYDQFLGSDGQYAGSWGCYPFQPSGVLYMSDDRGGLYVLSLAVQIYHDGVADTLDTLGPYPVVATIEPAVTGGSVTNPVVNYTTDEGQTWLQATMTATGNPDEFQGDVPGMPAGTTVQYYLTASDSLGSTRWPRGADHHFVFSVGARATHSAWSFDGATDNGWTHKATRGTDDWQRGSLAAKAGDPVEGWSPTMVWGNDLGGSGFNGSYASNSTNVLSAPVLDLTGQYGTRLRFRRWLNVASNDEASIRIGTTPIWTNAAADVTDDNWVLIDMDISQWADNQASVPIKFRLKTDGSDNRGGWNIDDVEVYCVDSCPTPTNYGTGTAGSGAFVPTLMGTGGPPHLGNNQFGWQADQIIGGAFCGVFVGFGQTSVQLKGVEFLVDLGLPYFLNFRRSSGATGVPGVGTVAYGAPIPNDPQAVGTEVDVQILAVDVGGPQGLSATPGLTFTICQ